MRHQLLAIFFLTISFNAFAQIQKPSSDMNYRKKITMADEFFQKGDFGSAAAFYQSAFEEKTNKTEIAYKAGEAFAKVRDYKNAALMYQVIKEETKDYPKGKYKYALALKQSGNYKTAMTEFDAFINTYKGEDFNEMNDKVANEVNGCQLGIRLANESKEPDVEIEHLSRMVNSDKNEYAPIPFVENLLYFSSMRDGMSQIFRSERGGGGWDKPEKPQIFGSMEKPHFGHGTFTPDRKSFYFTQCEMNLQGEFRCDLYVMQRKNNKWLKPVRLPDYINEANTTSTQPFVTVIDDKEVLYYVSDRDGGSGGLDIWYVMKDSDTEDFNFSLPMNVGVGINTTGDDVTPFYDKTAEVMYFSSNGHPGLGGLDVFRSNGHLDKWDKPVNLERPTNSGSDDHYYVLGSTREYGYFISNRLEGTPKEYSDNDDIFFFEKKEVEVVIKGAIAEKGNLSKLLDNVTVELIEINGTGSENSLITKIFNDGEYYFKLSPNKKYKIEATKDSYETTFFELETNNFNNNSEFTQDLELEKIKVAASIQPSTKPKVETAEVVTENPSGNRLPPIKPQNQPPVKPNEEATYTEEPQTASTKPQNQPPLKLERTETRPPATENPVVNTNEEGVKVLNFDDLDLDEKKNKIYFVDGEPYINKNGERYAVVGISESIPTANKFTTEPVNNTEVDFGTTVSEPETGEYYKIQLVAVSEYKPSKFNDVKNLGAIQLETTVDDNGSEVNRVMLTRFQSLDEAKAALQKVVNNSSFERAYIVKYVDGVRVRNSKIRLSSFRG